jgi:ATP-binding cassette, subfamily B, bacterial PglK
MKNIKKIWATLKTQQRKKVIALFALIVISAIIEMISISAILPIVSLMTAKDIAMEYPFIQPLLDALGNPDKRKLIIFAMFFLIFIYFVKTLFLSIFTYKKAKLITSLSSEISKDIYRSYLDRSYTFHLQNNSAQLIRNVTGEVNLFVYNVLSPLLIIIMETIIVIGIIFLLITIDPMGSMVIIGIFGIVGGYVFHVTRSLQKRWSKERQYHDGMILQQVQQGLGGIKQVKLLGREQEFEERFDVHNSRINRLSLFQTVMVQVPRLTFEFLAIVGIAMMVILMAIEGKNLEKVVPVIAVFSAAAFRLMPGITRIIQSINAYRYSQPSIDIVHNEVDSMHSPKKNYCKEEKDFKLQIELNNVNFSYSEDGGKNLHNINLAINQGDTVGIIGKSGSGKSTLVDVILGLLKPNEGVVKVDRKDIELNKRCWQNQIGYVPQAIFLTDDSLRRNVAFGLSDEEIDESAVNFAINAAELTIFIDNLPSGLDTIVGENGVRLSGGQRQRIGIARALYHNPSVLVLDEATSSLDIETEKSIMNTIESLHGKKTIIIISHRLNTVKYCDYLYKIDSGCIIKQGDFNMVVDNGVQI